MNIDQELFRLVSENCLGICVNIT